MSYTITVHVTQYHIDNGERSMCGSCPVYLALASALGHWQFNVATQTIYDDGPYFTRANIIGVLPYYVREWIMIFDRGRLVEPFSFEVTIDTVWPPTSNFTLT